MKIDIDLSGIFADEEGSSLNSEFAQRIEDAIVERANDIVSELTLKTFDREIRTQITSSVNKVLEDLIIKTLDDLYVPTNEWGYKEEQITLRNRICKDIERAMKWKDGSMSSGTDVYNKIIKDMVAEKLKEFSREFTKTIDDQFIAACMEHAIEKLRRVTKV